MMEFGRFGGTIPTAYWGCCAADVIQNFKVDPDAKAAIQIVDGDGACPLQLPNTKYDKDNPTANMAYAGPTYRDIFNQRIRIGTFGVQDMPNHAFFAILTSQQLASEYGKKWLAILKEAGFEFLRTTDNSVYTGQGLAPEGTVTPEPEKKECCDCGDPDCDADDYEENGSSHPNYIFALFRNIGRGKINDPHQPPKEWLDLPEQTKSQLEIWKENSPTKLISEAEAIAAEAPVYLAGIRSDSPQELKSYREARTTNLNKARKAVVDTAVNKALKEAGVTAKPVAEPSVAANPASPFG